MPMQVRLGDRQATIERDVKGEFGAFTILIRPPDIPDRLKARAMWLADDKFQERATFLLGFLAGWKGIIDQNGNPIPYTNDTRGDILGRNEKVLGATVAAIAMFFDEDLTTIAEDEQKNSEVLPASTEAPAAMTPQSSSTTG